MEIGRRSRISFDVPRFPDLSMADYGLDQSCCLRRRRRRLDYARFALRALSSYVEYSIVVLRRPKGRV